MAELVDAHDSKSCLVRGEGSTPSPSTMQEKILMPRGSGTIGPAYFAYKQYLDYLVYTELARTEKNPEFKATLEKLIEQELNDYEFWKRYGNLPKPNIPRWKITAFKILRGVFGLTFTAKFLEGREREMIGKYSAFLSTISDAKTRKGLEEIIRHERFHESQFIGQVKENKVEFLSNIILGLNDGLIELTGALVGFSLALQDHVLVALMGFITGISASLSMAAAAYLQAKHENSLTAAGREPKKAAFYTGAAYILVVILLIAPYFLIANLLISVPVMFLIAIGILGLVSFYSSTLHDESFLKVFGQMLLFSLGIAAITFAIGLLFRKVIGVGV